MRLLLAVEAAVRKTGLRLVSVQVLNWLWSKFIYLLPKIIT